MKIFSEKEWTNERNSVTDDTGWATLAALQAGLVTGHYWEVYV
jgi:hypothetical protein